MSDEMTLDELRLAIAERLGYRYYWYDYLGECHLRDLGMQNTSGMTTFNKRPDNVPINTEFVPEWPTDIAAAMDLVDDLPAFGLIRVGDKWQCTSRLCRAGEMGLPHTTILNGEAVCACRNGKGTSAAEAISRAWLKATE